MTELGLKIYPRLILNESSKRLDRNNPLFISTPFINMGKFSGIQRPPDIEESAEEEE